MLPSPTSDSKSIVLFQPFHRYVELAYFKSMIASLCSQYVKQVKFNPSSRSYYHLKKI